MLTCILLRNQLEMILKVIRIMSRAVREDLHWECFPWDALQMHPPPATVPQAPDKARVLPYLGFRDEVHL
jgi:hypothetical protein